MRLIDITGGAHGARDLTLLDAAAARPRATYDAEELYPTVFDKAAALMHSLILNHAMLDGNKRLGVAAAGLFLQRNGVRLTATNAALESFTLSVAEGRVETPEIARWFAQNTMRLQGDEG